PASQPLFGGGPGADQPITPGFDPKTQFRVMGPFGLEPPATILEANRHDVTPCYCLILRKIAAPACAADHHERYERDMDVGWRFRNVAARLPHPVDLGSGSWAAAFPA